MLPSSLTNVSFADIVVPASNSLCKELASHIANESDASQIVPSILQCSLNIEYNFSMWLSCIKEQDSHPEFFNHLELFCKKVSSIPIDQPCWSPLVKTIVRLTGPHILEKEKFVPIVKVFQSGLTSSNAIVRQITWSTWLYLSQHTLSQFSPDNYSPLIMKLLVLPLNKVPHRLTSEPRDSILLKLEIVKEFLRVCAPLNFDASYRIIETTLKLFYGSEISSLSYSPDICSQITELYLDMLQYSETSSCTVLLSNVLDKTLVCLLHSMSPGPAREELLTRVWTQACHHFKEVRCPTLYMDTVKQEMATLYTRFSPLLSPGLPSSPGSTVNRDFIPMKLIASLAVLWELTGTSESSPDTTEISKLPPLPRTLQASTLLEMVRAYVTEHEESRYLVALVPLLCREGILLSRETKILPTLLSQLKNKIRPEHVTATLFLTCLDVLESYRQSAPEQADLWIFLVTYYTELVTDDVIKISQPSHDVTTNSYDLAHRLLLFPVRLGWSEKLSKVWRKVYAGLVNSAALENTTARDSDFSLQLLSKLGAARGLEPSRVQLLFTMLTHTIMGGHKEVCKQVQDSLVSLLHTTSSVTTLDVAVSLCFTSVSQASLIAPLVAELNYRISDVSPIADRALTSKIIKLQRDVKQFRTGNTKPEVVGSKSAVSTNPRASSRFLQKLSQQQQEGKLSKVTPSSPAQNKVSQLTPTSLTPNKKDKSKLNTSVHEDGDTQDYVFIPPASDPAPLPLTQHQKEKLKLRPSDIPALYQDLSQSSSHSQDVNSQDCLVLPTMPSVTSVREGVDVDENATDVLLNEINIENQINRGEEDLSTAGRKREVLVEEKVTTRRSTKRNNENQAEIVQKDVKEIIPTPGGEENVSIDKSATRKSVGRGGKVERSGESNVKTRKSLLKENSAQERSDSPNMRKQARSTGAEEDKEDAEKRTKEDKSESEMKKKKVQAKKVESISVRMSPRKHESNKTEDKLESEGIVEKEATEKDVPAKEKDVPIKEEPVKTPTRLSKRKCSSPFNTKDFIVDIPKRRRSALWSKKDNESQSQDSQEKPLGTEGAKEKIKQPDAQDEEEIEKTSNTIVDKVDETFKASEVVPCNMDMPRKSILKSNKMAVDTECSAAEDQMTCHPGDIVPTAVQMKAKKNVRKSILKLPRASDAHVVTRKSVKFHAKIAQSNRTLEEQKNMTIDTKTQEVSEAAVEDNKEVEIKVVVASEVDTQMESDEQKPELTDVKQNSDETRSTTDEKNTCAKLIEDQEGPVVFNKREAPVVSTDEVSSQNPIEAKSSEAELQPEPVEGKVSQTNKIPYVETEKVPAADVVPSAALERKSVTTEDLSMWTTMRDPEKSRKCLNVSRVELNIRKKTIQEIYKHIHLYRSNLVTISDMDRTLINHEPLRAYEQFKNQILYNSIKFLLVDNSIYAVTDVTLKRMFGPYGGLRQNNTTIGLQHCTIANNTTLFGNGTLGKSLLQQSEKLCQDHTLGPVATYRQLNADTRLGSRCVNHMLVKKNMKNSFNFISNFSFILLSHPVALRMAEFNLAHLWSSEQLREMLEYFRGLNSVPIFLITVLTGDKNLVDKKFKVRLADKLKRLGDLDKYFVKYLDYKDWTYREDLEEDFNIYEAESTLIRIENVKFNFYISEENDPTVHTETIQLEATTRLFLEETKQPVTNETELQDPQVIAEPEILNNKSNTALADDMDKHMETQTETSDKDVVHKLSKPAATEINENSPVKTLEQTKYEASTAENKPGGFNDKNFNKPLKANSMIKPAEIPESQPDVESPTKLTKVTKAQEKTSPSKTRTVPTTAIDIPDTQDELTNKLNENKTTKPAKTSTSPAEVIDIANTQQDDEKTLKQDSGKSSKETLAVQEILDTQDNEQIPNVKQEHEKSTDPQVNDLSSEHSSLEVIESSQESSHLELKSPKHSSTSAKIFAHSTPFPSKLLSGGSAVKTFPSREDITSETFSRSVNTLDKPVLESTDEQSSGGTKLIHSPRRSGFSGSPRVSRIFPPAPLSLSPPRHSAATPPRSPHKTNEEQRRGKKTTPPTQSSLGGRGAAMLELLEAGGGAHPHPSSSSLLRKRLTPTRLPSGTPCPPGVGPQESPKSSRRSSRMLSLVQCAGSPAPGEEGPPHTSPPDPHTPRQTRWRQQHWTPGRTPTSGILRAVTTSGKKKLKVNFMEHPVSEELHFDKNKETLDNSLHILYTPVIGKKLQFQDPTEAEDTCEKLARLASTEEKIQHMKAAIGEGKRSVKDGQEKVVIEDNIAEKEVAPEDQVVGDGKQAVNDVQEKVLIGENSAEKDVVRESQVVEMDEENRMDDGSGEDIIKDGEKTKEITEKIGEERKITGVELEQVNESGNIEKANDDNMDARERDSDGVVPDSASVLNLDSEVGEDSSITTADFKIYLRETRFDSYVEEHATLNETGDALNGSFEGTQTEEVVEISQEDETAETAETLKTSQQQDETTQELNSFANEYDETFDSLVEEIDEIMDSQEELERIRQATLNETFTKENSEVGIEMKKIGVVEDNRVEQLARNRENVLDKEQIKNNVNGVEEANEKTDRKQYEVVDALISVSQPQEVIADAGDLANEIVENNKINNDQDELEEIPVDRNGLFELSNEDCSELKEKSLHNEQDSSEENSPFSEPKEDNASDSVDNADDERSSLDASRLASAYSSPLPSSLSSSQCHLTPTPLTLSPASLLYPPLLGVNDPVDDVILSLLCPDSAQRSLLASCLAKLGITTIGNLASLSRLQASSLPLGKRREDALVIALRKYESRRTQQPEGDCQQNIQQEESQLPERDCQQNIQQEESQLQETQQQKIQEEESQLQNLRQESQPQNKEEVDSQQEDSHQTDESEHNMEQTCVQQSQDPMKNIKAEVRTTRLELRQLAEQVEARSELVEQADASRDLEHELDEELELALALAARIMETKKRLKRKRMEQERQEERELKRRKL